MPTVVVVVAQVFGPLPLIVGPAGGWHGTGLHADALAPFDLQARQWLAGAEPLPRSSGVRLDPVR